MALYSNTYTDKKPKKKQDKVDIILNKAFDYITTFGKDAWVDALSGFVIKKPLITKPMGNEQGTGYLGEQIPGLEQPKPESLRPYDKDLPYIDNTVVEPQQKTQPQRDTEVNLAGAEKSLFNAKPIEGVGDYWKQDYEISSEDLIDRKLLAAKGDTESKYDKYYDEYTKNLDKANVRANIADTGMALWNLSALNRANKDYDTEDYKAPRVSAPLFQYPGEALRKAGETQIDKSVATRNKILREMGKPEYINTGDEIEARQRMEAGIIGQQYDVINKNIAAQTEAENKNRQIEAEVFNKNILKQMQENLMKGHTITQAMGALSEQARQFINRMTQTERNKFLAKVQLEQAKTNEQSLWFNRGGF